MNTTATQDAPEKPAHRGGRGFSDKTIEIIRLHKQKTRGEDICKIVGCHRSRIAQVVSRAKRTGQYAEVEA